MKIFIGHDDRESVVGKVCEFSINVGKATEQEVEFYHLKHLELRRQGLFNRPWLIRESGQKVDARDGKPFSTDFSHTRFIVPTLCRQMNYKGLAMFVDADFIFIDDITKLVNSFDWEKAVCVVKHSYDPLSLEKMDGQVQQRYGRKLWSSLMLFNMSHPANDYLSTDKVNNMPGSWLHSLGWLRDEQIGEIDERWNFIPGHSDERVDNPGAIHYTEGGPWFPRYVEGKWSKRWMEMYEHWLHCQPLEFRQTGKIL